ncbi:MAG: ABC transporter permease [Thermoanaerobaculia bacterium]
MGAYLARRLGTTAITLAGIVVAVFLLIHAAPGDPALLYAGMRRTPPPPEVLEAIRREHGFDAPLPVQFASWVGRAATLDLGGSILHRRPVVDVVAESLGPTLLLNGAALAVALLLGIPLGVASARRAGSLLDRGSAFVLFLLYSLPTFWTALILIELFAIRLGWLPLFGMESPGAAGASGSFADRLRHLVLPVAVLAYPNVAFFSRFVRTNVREVLAQDYVRTARAKGAAEDVVVWRHALRNALVPLVSMLPLAVPWVISGSIIVEQIFQWEGIGRLFFSAILSRDYPLVMGLTLLSAVVTMAASLVADLIYAAVDPRIRIGRSA